MSRQVLLAARLMLCFVVMLACSLTAALTAQDVIYKKDGKVLRVKVMEVGASKIRYTEYTDQDGIIFSMDRSLVREIELESGNVFEERQPGSDEAYFYDDSRSSIKIDFLQVGGGDILLGYEQSVNPSQSWEVLTRIMLPDFNEYWGGGFGLSGGYKIKMGSVFKGGDYRPKHLLAGGYIRPGVGFASREFGFGGDERFFMMHLGIDLGYQWIFSDVVSLDLFAGFHYYSYNESGNDRPDRFYDEEIAVGDMIGVYNRAGAFGLRIGYVFNSRADKEGIKRSRRGKRNTIN